jgi:hypothetical protein
MEVEGSATMSRDRSGDEIGTSPAGEWADRCFRELHAESGAEPLHGLLDVVLIEVGDWEQLAAVLRRVIFDHVVTASAILLFDHVTSSLRGPDHDHGSGNNHIQVPAVIDELLTVERHEILQYLQAFAWSFGGWYDLSL